MPAFMTDEWFQAASTVRAESEPFDTGIAARINLIVLDGESDPIHANINTHDGFGLDKGHVDTPDVTLTIPVAVARKMFIDGDQQAGMQAFMAGQLTVEGDITKVMSLQGTMGRPEAMALRERVAAITD